MVKVSVKEQVVDLIDRYVEVLDNGQLEEWADLFADESCYSVVSRENEEAGLPIAYIFDDSKQRIMDRVTTVREIWHGHYDEQYPRHSVTNIRVSPDEGNRVKVHANLVVHLCRKGEFPYLLATGQYKTVVSLEPEVRFLEKKVILDNSVLPSYFVYPL